MHNHIKNTAISQGNGIACIKQPVYAMLKTVDGKVYYGSNEMECSPGDTCPREDEGMVSGEGYHLCKEICKQDNHGERQATKRALDDDANTVGSIMYLVGHHYCCDECMSYMRDAYVNKVVYVEENREEML